MDEANLKLIFLYVCSRDLSNPPKKSKFRSIDHAELRFPNINIRPREDRREIPTPCGSSCAGGCLPIMITKHVTGGNTQLNTEDLQKWHQQICRSTWAFPADVKDRVHPTPHSQSIWRRSTCDNLWLKFSQNNDATDDGLGMHEALPGIMHPASLLWICDS